MQRYVVLCEITSRTIIKRIYKTKEEAQHYLAEIRNEILTANPPAYRILQQTEDELLIETINGEEIQMRYFIIGGPTADVIEFLSDIFGDDMDFHDSL